MKRIITLVLSNLLVSLLYSNEVYAQLPPFAVDLGLSVKWASCNLGSSNPEDPGLFYQWGDTNGYGSNVKDGKFFSCEDNNGNVSYKWCKGYDGPDPILTKYNTQSCYGIVDNRTTLDMEDDAARVSLGGNWRMPTDAEWAELMDKRNCTWKWTTLNGVYGYRVQSKKSGYTDKWIFLPSAGCRSGDELGNVGSYGYYWSSSLYLDSMDCACYVVFCSDGISRNCTYRDSGNSIRPVSE